MKRDVSNIIKQARELGDVAFNQGYEVSTEQLAANNGSGLVDDLLESAHSREKAELQKALAERVDQLAYLRTEINRLNAMLERSNAQAQSSLAELTKANKRIACQSENIEILQQQLSAERVSYSDTIERLQSDLDILKHEYAKAQHAITDRDTRITQITQDKIDLSHKRDRLQSRAEVFKITAFTAGMLFLVTLFCLIVILVGLITAT